MPFMGRDWRSPGEAWVKTESLGWQRMKIIESQLYLTACPASHPACSWPPRSQFGQHMADNCEKQHQQQPHSNMNCDQTDGETGICRRRLASSVDDETGSSSSERSSTSTSPTSSPEKNLHNNNNLALHHIHRPITISSPYGRYSTTSCCTHHVHPAGPTNQLATTNTNWHNGSPATKPDHGRGSCHCCPSRSLSREKSEPRLKQADETSVTSSISSDNILQQKLLRHNKSEPDFGRNLTGTTATNFQVVARDDKTGQQHAQSDAKERVFQLDEERQSLESDVRINVDEACSEDSAGNRSAPSTTSASGATPSSPPLTCRPGQDNGRLSSSPTAGSSSCGGCCCCCCSSSTSQLAPEPPRATSRCCHHYQQQQPQQLNPHLIADSQTQKPAPHCRISVRTREVAMHNTISEAFYRLDFYNAIHDIRRFNYICKLLHLLITQNLTSLSGCASRVLFTMLEQVAWEVSANKRNINVIRNLLADLKQTIQKYYCWGRPIGSSLLWQQHFETIERISQIVDEIELSPPKSDTCKVTFDKLPVEMIREILLRLTDYRDLVNSAQASPVMRTMIDNQCVWQKMCRYHFTDQQLKLAFESNKFNFVKKQQHLQSGQLRGIKYARTTSADGRNTYRSPVVVTAANKRNPSTAPASQRTDRPQPQQQQQPQQSSQTDDERRASSTDSKSSSYVTNAVRIFDKHRSSPPSGSSSSSPVSQSTTRPSTSALHHQQQQQQQQQQQRNQENNEPRQQSSNGTANDSERPTLEIDWERVFHQLRKRFDLKEEYADCLLLCRHCRCLFWKSFGHPCIKSDEPVRSACCHRSSSRRDLAASNGRGAGSSNNNNDYDCDNCNRSNEQERPTTTTRTTTRTTTAPLGRGPAVGATTRRDDSAGGMPAATVGSRVSVALLSRNFDRQALGGGGGAHDNDENALASDGGRGGVGRRDEHTPGALSGGRSQHLDNGRRPRHGQAARRQPLDNLSAQLGEHNVDRQGRHEQQRQWQPWQQQQPPPPASNHRRPDAGRDGGALAREQRNRGEELVPKHVTISPQAFLKFFSL